MTEENPLDYKKLNEEEIRKNLEDIKIEYDSSKKITEKEFNQNLAKLIKPNINVISNSFEGDSQYIPKVSDPYKRLLQLKTELLKNKSDIDEVISKYNDISSKINTSDSNNYSLLYSNAQKSKNKIDSFINYDIIKKRQMNKGYDSDSDSDLEEEDEQKKLEKAKERQQKNEEKKQNILNKREENEKMLKQLEENADILFKENGNAKSINEKYYILANNILSKLNTIDSDLNVYMKYKVCSIPDYTLTLVNKKIIEVESEISKIENVIGDYDFNFHKSTIFGTLKYLARLNTEATKNKENIFTRYESSRGYESMISKFNEDENNGKLMRTYKLLCESYLLYLSMKKFEDVISYLKKRIIAIKSIILNAEQFDFDIKQLNELIKKNSENYEILRFKYLQTLESFADLDTVLKEVNNLDVLVKKKI